MGTSIARKQITLKFTLKKKSYIFNIQLILRYICLKGEFVVLSTAKICGWSLSSKISVDMNSIFMKLYVTWPTWPKGHIPQKFEFSRWYLRIIWILKMYDFFFNVNFNVICFRAIDVPMSTDTVYRECLVTHRCMGMDFISTSPLFSYI
jgi:hypothetical protein